MNIYWQMDMMRVMGASGVVDNTQRLHKLSSDRHYLEHLPQL